MTVQRNESIPRKSIATKENPSMKYFRNLLLVLLAGLIALASSTASADSAKKLNVFIWSQYMDPAIIKQFEKENDVKVVMNYYGSLPEMFAKLRAGGDSLYDIVVPSSYYVPRLIQTGLLQPLNKKEIPNIKNLMDKFENPPFDPGNKYTVAYQWGTTGLAYNTKMLPDAPQSWGILFDPKVNPDYPFVLGTDAQVIFGVACAYAGKPYTCTGAEDWKQAAKLVLKTKQRSNFNGFMDNTPMLRQLARGNVAAGLSYNGDYVFVKAHNPDAYADTKFIIPKEGAELWVDSMAIPAHAPHPDLANKFINFILNAKIGAQLSNYNYYATPNKASVQYLTKVLQQPPILPTDEQMKRLHYTPSLKGKQLHVLQQLWTAVKSH